MVGCLFFPFTLSIRWMQVIVYQKKVLILSNFGIGSYIFSDYREALKKETEMIKKATKEIQIIYSTASAFHLQEKIQ